MPAEEDAAEIEIRQGAGGKSAYVGKSRIRVADIAQMYELMREEVVVERIQRSLPSLTTDQIHAALDYWRTHKEEIDSLIAEEEAILEKLSRGN
jgi:uncharacterized protein (DUF433 family)